MSERQAAYNAGETETKNSDGSVSKGEVWNPVTGCTKVSQGCKNCYAERIASRFWGERKFSDVVCHEDRLTDPFRWKKPRRVFVNSMSDLFHEDVPKQFIVKVFNMMFKTKQHTYMVLTKRPERMMEFLIDQTILDGKPVPGWNLGENIWLGVSVENQETADKRIPLLLQTPAAVRFVSVEPMLGPISLHGWDGQLMRDYIGGNGSEKRGPLDWVICGCESGPGARPFSEDWARRLKDQCVEADVPFFYKQGRHTNGQNIKMPVLDGQVWDQYPKEQP